MKSTFDYLENVAFAACVCDREGVVLYQNERSIKRDGQVVGKNLYDCHNPHSCQMIRHMIQTGQSNSYQIIRHGKKRLLHQTPWYEVQGGEVSGLIELSIDIPDDMPVFNRDL